MNLELNERARLAFSKHAMELTIFPTEKCNYRCTYCYEDFKIGRMSKNTCSGIKALVERRAEELQYLDIMWFGGEPLLADDIIFELSHAFLETCKRHNINYSANITTNGHLLDTNMFHSCLKAKITTFQISLDGPEVIHNKTRVQPSGKPTFASILKNLRAMRDQTNEFKTILRIHITPENYESLPILIDELGPEFLSDRRFIPHFVPVGKLGGPNDSDFDVLKRQKSAGIVAELMRRVAQYRPEYANFLDKAKSCEICYAAKPNALIIRATGRIAKCTVALNDSRNDLGKIRENGDLEISNERYHPWLTGWINGDSTQLACPLHTVPELSGEVVRKIVPIQAL